jgi:FkbM family methyltransferase
MLSYLNVFKQIINHPANEGKQIESLFRALYWQLTAKSKEATEINFFGYKILVHNPEVARRLIYFHCYYDFNSMKFMEHYLRAGDRFIDIGANIGVYTLFAASIIGKNGHIYAFEPFPTTFERLKQNIKRNNLSQVNLYPYATGRYSEIVNFTTGFDTRNFVVSNELISNHKSNIIKINCKPINLILSNNDYYDLAKIDVEGYELQTLQGANKLLEKHNPPVILIEINGLQERYNKEQQLVDFLNSKGYKMHVYNTKKNIIEKVQETSPLFENYIFIAEKNKNKVINRISSQYRF